MPKVSWVRKMELEERIDKALVMLREFASRLPGPCVDALADVGLSLYDVIDILNGIEPFNADSEEEVWKKEK